MAKAPSFQQARLWRGDLARALRGDDDALEWVQDQLGLVRVRREAPPPPVRTGGDSKDSTAPPVPQPPSEPTPKNRRPAPARFWRATKLEPQDTAEARKRVEEERAKNLRESEEDSSAEGASPNVVFRDGPLAEFADIFARLREQSAHRHSGRRIDEKRAVERLARCRDIHRFPTLESTNWGTQTHLVLDNSRRLFPYRNDLKLLVSGCLPILSRANATICEIDEGVSRLDVVWPESRWGEVPLPVPGEVLIVLGDLGVLAREETSIRERWVVLGRQWRDAGGEPVAVVPFAPDRASKELRQTWRLIAWERANVCWGLKPRAGRGEPLADLMGRLSLGVKAEPQLLRALRRSFEMGRRDAGLESEAWQLADRSQNVDAAAFSEETLAPYRDRVKDSTIVPEAYALQQMARTGAYKGVIAAETLNLAANLPGLVAERQVRDALEWFRSDESQRFLPQVSQVFSKESRRLYPEIADAQQQGDAKPYLTIRQGANEWLLGGDAPGSPLGTLKVVHNRVDIDAPYRPSWAIDAGDDHHGHWAELEFKGARQRLRWIRPETFSMGSPDSDEEAFGDEKPQHQVTLIRGYWLFDTPCTQEFWQAVMDENPSEFTQDDGDDRAQDRPVEQVSWEDCQTFIERLNAVYPDLKLRLPTEAQWEYACRAGSNEPRYGELDMVAWHDGNSGKRTHAVKRKDPNAWGFYDMLGNVYEWVQDWMWRSYSEEPVTDPEHGAPSVYRVVRGGSYFRDPRDVRAACRGGIPPSNRNAGLGFRCASLDEGPEAREGSRPRSAAARSGATGEGSAASLGADQVTLEPESGVSIQIPEVPSLWIRSDRDHLQLALTQRPSWAKDMGRDRHGLWADFSVEPNRGEPVIQRMRWIHPGRFKMGSPETEEGRLNREGPQHEVILTNGFWLFDTPCTQALWEAVTGKNPSHFPGPLRPVEQVSWDDVASFLPELNAKVPHLSFRLPSEAQWEYACRAGSCEARHGDIDEIAWYEGNSDSETHEVKQKQANQWGLYDMLGNVWEWVQDYGYREYTSEAAIDPEHGAPSDSRVIRGGSCFDDPGYVRAGCRAGYPPSSRVGDLGFRCASSETVGPEARSSVPTAAEPRPESGARGGSGVEDRDRPKSRIKGWRRFLPKGRGKNQK